MMTLRCYFLKAAYNWTQEFFEMHVLHFGKQEIVYSHIPPSHSLNLSLFQIYWERLHLKGFNYIFIPIIIRGFIM